PVESETVAGRRLGQALRRPAVKVGVRQRRFCRGYESVGERCNLATHLDDPTVIAHGVLAHKLDRVLELPTEAAAARLVDNRAPRVEAHGRRHVRIAAPDVNVSELAGCGVKELGRRARVEEPAVGVPHLLAELAAVLAGVLLPDVLAAAPLQQVLDLAQADFAGAAPGPFGRGRRSPWPPWRLTGGAAGTRGCPACSAAAGCPRGSPGPGTSPYALRPCAPGRVGSGYCRSLHRRRPVPARGGTSPAC